MKKLPAAGFWFSLLSLASGSVAQQVTEQVSFDEVVNGTLVNTHYAAMGVTFDCALGTNPASNECLNTNSTGFGGNVFARMTDSPVPHSGNNVVDINNFGGDTAFNELNGFVVARFPLPVLSVSIWAAAVFPANGQPMVTSNLPYLNAYDVNGIYLATARYSNSPLSASLGWVQLNITPSMVNNVPIGMVAFSSSAPAGSTVFTLGQFDDLSFTLPTAKVPPVAGMPLASAEALITQANLTVGPIAQQPSSSLPAGNVISQNPAAGTVVLQGSAVSLVESCGAATVPFMIHLPLTTAENDIVAAGLKVGSVAYQRSTIPAGDVISTSPGGWNTICSGTTVNLLISSGSNPPPLP